MDDSNESKPQSFHTDTTSRAGGIGVIAGLLLIVFSMFGMKFFFSIVLAFLSGIFEDLHNSLSPKLRLVLQFLAAVTAVIFIKSVVTYLGLGITLPYWLGAIFSIFAIVGMMNAINIIDGFNGLASGVILAILISFLFVANLHEDYELAYAIVIILGATLGFFVFNFPKGKIFLGDGGAYMLGFVVSVIGIYMAGEYETVSPWYILATFIYPVWEVCFSIIRKLTIGLSPMQPDKYHLHMLVYRHITHNNPLTALVMLTSFIPFFVLSCSYSHSSLYNIYIVSVFIIVYIVVYFYLYHKEKA